MGLFNSLKIVNCLLTDSSYKNELYALEASLRLLFQVGCTEEHDTGKALARSLTVAKPKLLEFLAITE